MNMVASGVLAAFFGIGVFVSCALLFAFLRPYKYRSVGYIPPATGLMVYAIGGFCSVTTSHEVALFLVGGLVMVAICALFILFAWIGSN